MAKTTKITDIVPKKVFNDMVRVRRAIHKEPELAYKEHKTAALIVAELEKLGIEILETGVGKTGVVASIGSKKGPVVALRADMDALAIGEETGLSFTSKVPGVMHACGHDGHVAMLLGAAALLKAKPPPRGRVLFVFQPAEEGGAGAKKILASGLLNGASAIFGCHLDRHFKVGRLVVQEGPISAYTDGFEISIQGKGGHAAQPHDAIDAIVVASMLVMSLQTIVSREANPAHPLIVSVGKIEGGSVHNAVAEHARLFGTIRSTEVEARKKVMHGIKRIAHGAAALHDAYVRVKFKGNYGPVVNSVKETAIAAEAATQILGKDSFISSVYVNMGGEDFSFYQKKIPGCFVRVGAQKKGLENIPAHSAHFDFDESALRVGAAFMVTAARLALERS